MSALVIERIAAVCHEANRVFCALHGDLSQPGWETAPEWQKSSAISGVEFTLAHPDAGPGAQHDAWLAGKERAGWRWGPVKDALKQEHPDILPFDELPRMTQVKDALFQGIVRAMTPLVP